ncbi:MAG: hypothetical protein V1721_00470 [Pseudomonadota bacterium]
MPEQTINILSLGMSLRTLCRKLCILAVSCIAFALSACIPVGDQEINTELFKSKEDLRMRVSALAPGMTKRNVFETISISPEKFSRMNTQEVQMSIYGNSMVQGTPEQLEQFKQRMLAYEGYSLPYREIKSSGSLGFGSLKVNKNGYDLQLVVIFERGRLLRASVDGNQDVNLDENESMWNILLKKGTGIGF